MKDFLCYTWVVAMDDNGDTFIALTSYRRQTVMQAMSGGAFRTFISTRIS